ncbi:hypothetical protein C8Q79DRAFT_1011223 [Trametes meyenii]|nr:hypothetical protein C8Q79DRAFT_1011223 [Trametes meyenii]
MRGSMLSVTSHARLPDIAQLFGARKDIVPTPNPTPSGSQSRMLDESSDGAAVDAEAEVLCSGDDGLLLFGGGSSSRQITRRVPPGSSALDESQGSHSFSPAAARATLKLPGAPPTANVDGISETPTNFGPHFGLSGSRSGGIFLPQARSGAALSGESVSIDSCVDKSEDTIVARALPSCSDSTSSLFTTLSARSSVQISEECSPEAGDDPGAELCVASPLAAETRSTVLHPKHLIESREKHARVSSLSSSIKGQLRQCAAHLATRHNVACPVSHQQPRLRQTTAPASYTPSSIPLLEHCNNFWEARGTSQRQAQSTSPDSASSSASSSGKENHPPTHGRRDHGDAWAFESESGANVSFPNRGHQRAPGPVGRHRHASDTSGRGRTRTQTAPGQVGTGTSGAGRGRTRSGRFDVLEREEFI